MRANLPYEIPHLPRETRHLLQEMRSFSTGNVSSPLEMRIPRTHVHISRRRRRISKLRDMWHCWVILFSSVNSSQKKKQREHVWLRFRQKKKRQILPISKTKNSQRVKFQWAKLTDKKLQWANLQMRWAIAHLPPPWLRHWCGGMFLSSPCLNDSLGSFTSHAQPSTEPVGSWLGPSLENFADQVRSVSERWVIWKFLECYSPNTKDEKSISFLRKDYQIRIKEFH
jgi:hypothetical protein